MKNNTYIIQKSEVTQGGVLNISLTLKNGQEIFYFKPGQYVMLSFYDKQGKLCINHPFSICSSPAQKKYLQLGIKIIGNFTQRLSKLEIGDEVSVMGPYGNFVFDERKHKKAFFIAGGIGITPFMSAVRYATEKRLQNEMILLYSNRQKNGITFFDEILS